MTNFNSNQRSRRYIKNTKYHKKRTTANTNSTPGIKKDKYVIIIAKVDYANVSNRLNKAINKTTDWKSNCIIGRDHIYSYERDILSKNISRSKLQKMIYSAQFILFGSTFYNWTPRNIKIPKDTPKGLWHGGENYRRDHKRINKVIHPEFDIIFAHEDLIGLYNKSKLLLCPYDAKNISPPDKSFDSKLIIGHTPSQKYRKRTDVFKESGKILKDKYGNNIEIKIVTNKPNKQILEYKKEFHIFFDQITRNKIPENGKYAYGVNALESAAYEQAILARHDMPDSPILYVETKDDIINTISSLVEDRAKLKNIARETRQWVIRKHSYENIAKKFIRDIKTVI